MTIRRILLVVFILAFCLAGAAKSDQIHKAAKDRDLEKVKAIVKKNPESIKEKDTKGWTALFWAVYNNDTDMASFLIDSGSVLETKDYTGLTPLYLPIGNDNPEMAKLLLAKGANPNGDGDLVIFAITSAKPECLQILLDAKADANQKDNLGNSALHHAARLGDLPKTKILVEHSARLNDKNKDNQTPLKMAETGKQKKVADYLRSCGAVE